MAKTMVQLPYHYGVKVRIFPSTEQKRLIKRNSDASRFIYNQMNGMNNDLFWLKQVKIPITIVLDRIADLTERLKKPSTAISNAHGWLNHPDFDSLMKANAIKNYKTAWKLFHQVHQAGTPKFHKRSYTQTYQTSCLYSAKVTEPSMSNGSVRLIGSHHLQLPKLERLRFKGLPSKILDQADDIRIGTTTVSMDAVGHYFVSLQLGSEQPFITQLPAIKSKVGIDLNLENFLTDSNGQVIDNPRYYRTIRGKLAKAQRKLSRRARRAKKSQRRLSESKNYQKQRILVARLQLKVANQRKNFLHQVSTALIKNHDLVVAEELRSKNMLRNHALAMSISDVGWRTLLAMLSYKARLYGRKFLTINPRNTTQTCSHCGYIMTGENKLTLADRKWTCPNCGAFHVCDHNAAKNILARGVALL